MEASTVAIYEAEATRYATERGHPPTDRADRFRFAVERRRCGEGESGPAAAGLRLDLGCGPGGHLGALGTPVIGTDAAPAMLTEARRAHPDVPLVAHDLEALPFAPGSLAGVWASKCLQHIPHGRLPLALAGLHAAMTPGAPLHATMFTAADNETDTFTSTDSFPGRAFWTWSPDRLATVVRRAGFSDVSVEQTGHEHQIDVTAVRAELLPDATAANLRVLLVGLNPSWHAVRAGYGYAGPGNRFWPAALTSGLVSVAHDPRQAVTADRVGFTDLVKRPTARAAEVTTAEFRAGADELEEVVRWLHPRVVCLVGLSGWRTARDRKAAVGWQPKPFGGRPLYVMPNPSGLNAATPFEAFVEHFKAVARGPGHRVGTGGQPG